MGKAEREARRRKKKKGKYKRTGEVLKLGKPIVPKKKTVKKKEPSKVAPVIKLKPKEKEKKRFDPLGEKKLREEFEERGVELAQGTLPIGPAGVGIAKDVVKGIGMAFGKAKKVEDIARITRTAERLSKYGKSLTTQRAFIGKPAKTGVNKIFNAGNRAIASRFATNTKSLTLTQKFLKFAKSPAGVVSIIGSYPFAGFIKEEALQTIGMGFYQASQNNDVVGMEMAIKEEEDILDAGTWEKMVSLVPYANVVNQLKDFFKAARVKLQIDKGIFEKAKAEQAGQETEFQRERRESDEAARERTLQFRAEDEEYYNAIEAERLEDKEKGREEDSEYYRKIADENRARKLKEREEDEAYYAQFR